MIKNLAVSGGVNTIGLFVAGRAISSLPKFSIKAAAGLGFTLALIEFGIHALLNREASPSPTPPAS